MKFRKKPVVIEAVQWTGENLFELIEWGLTGSYMGVPKELIISTLEGPHLARVGDWIIRGVNGEFYPCKPDIFEKTYEPVGPCSHRMGG